MVIACLPAWGPVWGPAPQRVSPNPGYCPDSLALSGKKGAGLWSRGGASMLAARARPPTSVPRQPLPHSSSHPPPPAWASPP